VDALPRRRQTVVAYLKGLSHRHGSRGQDIVPVKVVGHARRRLSSTDRCAMSRDASATCRRCSLAAAKIASCANVRKDISSFAAAARTCSSSASVNAMFNDGTT
jgi:hypothetical protein